MSETKVDLRAEKEYQKLKLRPRLFYPSFQSQPYERPKAANEIKGKLNRKFAKKQRVKTLKAQQA